MIIYPLLAFSLLVQLAASAAATASFPVAGAAAAEQERVSAVGKIDADGHLFVFS